jgi:hypothetical protein
MHPYHYDVSLHFTHPSASPEEITKAMGIQATRTHKVGEPRTTPTGTPLKGLYKKSYWSADLSGNKRQYSEAAELEECLVRIARQLEPAKDFMCAFVESGGEIEFFIGLFCPQNSGMILPWQLLGRLASLRVGLSLDYYPGTPDSTS